MTETSFEGLGVFYLGRRWTADQGVRPEPLLYDAKDLTTHALIVGMTGSGKTGLAIDLLEEAAIDGVPALVIDPKGDMGNLLLSFPELRPADFEPWIDPAEAARKGRTTAEHAAWTADLWREGLAEWGQTGERIRRYRDAVDLTLYTPGSSAGVGLSVLQSFDPPSEAVRRDGDALRQRIQGAVGGLLALLGIDPDPVRSREHILLANLLETAWSANRGLDLAGLIREILKPPFERLGVFDLETFFPEKERTELAMQLNGLLASPGFGAWLEGEPMDVERLLFTAEGKPRISIVSIAHLGDSERMFVVSLLLNEVLSWMRSQSGTSSLRALLYMDEIFGFFPPSREPPSKTAMLTLLKQARAFGLGVVLSTQNPVDLDYKGLSNCGTWFLGRLQTERDKARVLEGLESAVTDTGGGLERSEIDDLLSSLGKRVFLMNNVHEDGPELFQTRWAMSYLRGPLVRDQIESLMAERKRARAQREESRSGAEDDPVTQRLEPARTPVGGGVDEWFVRPMEDLGRGESLVWRPRYLGVAKLHFKHRGSKLDCWRERAIVAPIDQDGSALWEEGTVLDGEGPKRSGNEPDEGRFAELPAACQRKRTVQAAERSLKDHLYRTQRLPVYREPETGEYSRENEDLSRFRQRLKQVLAEERDRELEKLRLRHAREIEKLDGRIRTAQERLDREESQLRERKLSTAVSLGTSVLGALLGRKKLSVTSASRVARTVRDLGRSRREKDDVERVEERLEDLVEEKEELERRLETELGTLSAPRSPDEIEVEVQEATPLKSDLGIVEFGVAWTPWAVSAEGIARPLDGMRRSGAGPD